MEDDPISELPIGQVSDFPVLDALLKKPLGTFLRNLLVRGRLRIRLGEDGTLYVRERKPRSRTRT